MVLLVAASQLDGACQQTLVERTGLDRTTVSEILPDLVEDGVLRCQPALDRRQTAVRATESTASAAREGLKAVRRAESVALRPLDQRQRNRFALLLKRAVPAYRGLW